MSLNDSRTNIRSVTFVSLDVYSYLKPYLFKIELSDVYGQWKYDELDVVKIIYADYKFKNA